MISFTPSSITGEQTLVTSDSRAVFLARALHFRLIPAGTYQAMPKKVSLLRLLYRHGFSYSDGRYHAAGKAMSYAAAVREAKALDRHLAWACEQAERSA